MKSDLMPIKYKINLWVFEFKFILCLVLESIFTFLPVFSFAVCILVNTELCDYFCSLYRFQIVIFTILYSLFALFFRDYVHYFLFKWLDKESEGPTC